MEGEIKVKELKYMKSEGIIDGEMKNGKIEIVDNDMNVIMIIKRDNVYVK
jgi:glucosamine 6-phosphate synthetase-like amidotransferase/phosphosugar isomerase protein